MTNLKIYPKVQGSIELPPRDLEGQDSVFNNLSNETSEVKAGMEMPPTSVTWSHKIRLAVEPGVSLKVHNVEYFLIDTPTAMPNRWMSQKNYKVLCLPNSPWAAANVAKSACNHACQGHLMELQITRIQVFSDFLPLACR